MVNIVITGLVGIVSTCISWMLAKRKYNSEVDHTIIQNMQESLEFYKRLSDDNKSRLEEVLKRNEILEGEVRKLKAQMFELATSICTDLTYKVKQSETFSINKVKNEENKS